MRTKTQLLLLTIVGNMVIAGIFLGLSSYREDKQESANLAASASLYQQAWDTMANDYFSQGIGTWHPQTGAIEKRGIWNETSGYNFPEDLDFDGPSKIHCSMPLIAGMQSPSVTLLRRFSLKSSTTL